jgi:hypothetical protein
MLEIHLSLLYISTKNMLENQDNYGQILIILSINYNIIKML